MYYFNLYDFGILLLDFLFLMLFVIVKYYVKFNRLYRLVLIIYFRFLFFVFDLYIINV